MKTCRQLKEFLTEMADLKKEFGVVEESKSEAKAPGGGFALGNLVDDSDFDSMDELEEEFKQVEESLIPVNPTKEDLTMCCC